MSQVFAVAVVSLTVLGGVAASRPRTLPIRVPVRRSRRAVRRG